MSEWHIVTCEYPPHGDGVGNYTQLVARGLAAAGDAIHVWCPSAPAHEQEAGVHVHPLLGSVSPGDLRRVDQLLDEYAAPRRLLVQWVPHGFGYHSMNVAFCLWLRRRARKGDQVELMVHEPCLGLWSGSIRQTAAAVVHRFMSVVLIGAASRIWIAIPTWERVWRPYALGRSVTFEWLPIPNTLPMPLPDARSDVTGRVRRGARNLVGHLSGYGPAVAKTLLNTLPDLMGISPHTDVLLLGRRSETLLELIACRHPQFAHRLHATGYLPPQDLAQHIAVCDLLIQPYPDGISTRRTSAMAGLALGVPVVTNAGALTEPMWADRASVALANDAAELPGMVARLLDDADERERLSVNGKSLYEDRFDVAHTIAALRRGDCTTH